MRHTPMKSLVSHCRRVRNQPGTQHHATKERLSNQALGTMRLRSTDSRMVDNVYRWPPLPCEPLDVFSKVWHWLPFKTSSACFRNNLTSPEASEGVGGYDIRPIPAPFSKELCLICLAQECGHPC